ncbi:endonuclease domain-containing protein [Mycobacterium talmoniae]|uniref:DUF559 domain-containing protein n=1 Tax=Mycobacterium talmoniae TaxID=1858794 RepID=A0A1S1NMK2_9MYCO|nr:DUF559 domain-containing protein [Mycobacterium talmoniae]OHV05983.1 hypothetical protein BKN37_03935 [Mycobacterium talmoniae]PQM46056.1 hypothetical protein C1Y40_03764 [Mycobacterium talmoniae]
MGAIEGPFLGTEALAAGTVSRRALATYYRAIYRNVYLANDQQLTPTDRAVAAWLWSDRQATAAGLSAAALHGSQWIDADLPAELYRRNGKAADGILMHRDELGDDEVCLVNGIRVTTAARTAYDLGRRAGWKRAVVRLDALFQATDLVPADVEALADNHRGARGIVQLRRVLDLVDGGAESPQETRTRLVLVTAGLPKPQTQIRVRDEFGAVFARLDMGYEEFKVAVEYDGEQHWTDPARRAHDIDRHAKLLALGWIIIRVSAEMLRYRPHVIVERTCAALHAAGAEWPVIARFLLKNVS